MKSAQLVFSANKLADSRSNAERASPAAAVVEIGGFPQVLHTRTYGDPDTLFVPLLDAAREAYRMVERLRGHGEERATVVRLSAMQLASALLRESGFSLAARGMSQDNSYFVDLDADTFLVRTRLYAVVSRRMSFFKVEIVGKISQGSFVVRNPVQGSTISRIEEEKLRRANFFASSLAQDCLRVQMEQERFGQTDEAPASEAHRELRLVLPINGVKIPITLRQKEENGCWDIIDGRNQERVGALAANAEGPLASVFHSVQELFSEAK